MKKSIIPFIAMLLLMASCSMSKKITYFQDIIVVSDSTVKEVPPPEITLRPEDKISIIVNSKNRELTDLFNLSYVTRTIGSISDNATSHGISYYTVRSDGTIDFPVLGSVKVAGLTREGVADYIKSILISQNLVNDPIVTVEFANLQFFVMGEVRTPGAHKISHDRVTILDAISQAGDMNIDGRRDNVLVLRPDTTGIYYAYQVDMRSFDNVVNSPVYYIHQNDYIYVEPNKKRANQSTVNANTVSSASFWISISSLLASLASTATLIFVRLR